MDALVELGYDVAHEYGQIQARVAETLRRWLVTGVTAVVDVGGPFWNFDVRDLARRTLLAPRVAVAGPLVSTIALVQQAIARARCSR